MNKLFLLFALLLSLKCLGQVSDFEHVNFKEADRIAKQLKGAPLNNLPVLAYKLTSELQTDVEKFRAIFIWVCSNIENDYGNHVQNLKKRRKFQKDSTALYNWNDQFKEKALKKLIKQKKTICTGYAYLLQELALLAGLNCKMVHGYGRTVSSNVGKLSIPNHSWNVVQLGNKWYLSDPTWASGFFHLDENTFIPQYNDGYFLASPELFVKSHYPLDTRWLLTDNKISIEDFINGPLVYGNTYKYKITPLEPEFMEFEVFQGQRINFKYKVSSKFNNDELQLIVDSGFIQRPVEVLSLNEADETLLFNYTFNKRGVYDVHLKVKEDIVSTHVVKVLKKK